MNREKENKMSDKQKAFWCIYAVVESSGWPTDDEETPNSHWELIKGTKADAEAELTEWKHQAVQHRKEIEEEYGDKGFEPVINVRTHLVKYDPTKESHVTLVGYEEERPEYHEYQVKNLKLQVEREQASLVDCVAKYKELQARQEAKIRRKKLAVSKSLKELYLVKNKGK